MLSNVGKTFCGIPVLYKHTVSSSTNGSKSSSGGSKSSSGMNKSVRFREDVLDGSFVPARSAIQEEDSSSQPETEEVWTNIK